MHLSVPRGVRELLQIEFSIGGDYRQRDAVAIAQRNKSPEYPFGRKTDFCGDARCSQIFGIDLVFTQFVVNTEPVEQTDRVRFMRHDSVLMPGHPLSDCHKFESHAIEYVTI